MAAILPVFLLGALSMIVFAHGGNTNFVHGCIRPLTGLLRIIGADDNCGPNETPLDWRQFPEPGTEFPYVLSGGTVTQAMSDKLRGRNLTNSVIENSTWVDLNFVGTIFSNADLRESSFQSVDFTGSNFTNVSFLDADFIDDVNLANCNLNGANFDGTNRTGIIWSNTTCPDGTNSDNNGNTCEGHLTP